MVHWFPGNGRVVTCAREKYDIRASLPGRRPGTEYLVVIQAKCRPSGGLGKARASAV